MKVETSTIVIRKRADKFYAKFIYWDAEEVPVKSRREISIFGDNKEDVYKKVQEYLSALK